MNLATPETQGVQVSLTWETLEIFLKQPIAYHRIFADIGGGAMPGLFLSQSYYWSQRTDDHEGWFYKSIEDWEKETGLTRYEQETARKRLKKVGIIEEKKRGVPCRLYFRINRSAFTQAIATIWVNKQANTGKKRAGTSTPSQFGENHQTSQGKTTKQESGKPPNKPGENHQTSQGKTTKQESGKPPNYLYTETTNRNYSESTSEITAHEESLHTQAAAVSVEVLDPEPLPGDRNNNGKDSSDLRQLNPSRATEVNIPFGQENLDPGENQSSEAARDNKYNGFTVDKLEKLQDSFDSGEVTDLPDREKKALALYLMGETIASYRKSGKILASSPNDIDRAFLQFHAWNELGDETDLSWSRNTIVKYERTMSLWGTLVTAVDDWQEYMASPSKFQQKALKRANSKRGTTSELDKNVATTATVERFRQIQEQQVQKEATERARKAAQEAQKVKTPEVSSEPPTGAASPHSGNDYDPEAIRIAKEKTKVALDAIAAKVAEQQAQRRRA